MDLSSLEILNTIGVGSIGRIMKVLNKETGEHLALKMLPKHKLIRLKQVDHTSSELHILRQISHPSIVKYRGFFQDRSFVCIALDYMLAGDLFFYLRSIQKLNYSHAKLYTGQIVIVFEYLHSLNIVYRDLKPENILFGEDGYLKLTDFGLSKKLTSKTYTLCGTPEYMAPEVILNKGYGKTVDWWTLGVLTYEMVTGRVPFFGNHPMEIYTNIAKCKPKFPRSINKQCKQFIKKLLTKDLSKRLGNLRRNVLDLKRHIWLEDINWKALADKQIQMPYVPTGEECTGHYRYSDTYEAIPIDPLEDPFINW